MSKVVKPGSITDSDCQFFIHLAKDIGDKYTIIGIQLGLKFKDLQNELEGGPMMFKQANDKALKMLQLWHQFAGQLEGGATYSTLADALEKHGLRRAAHEYCYTEPTPGSEGAGAAGPFTPNVEDKDESTVNVSCENRDYDLCEEGGPSAAGSLSAFVNTHLIWKGRKELYVKFMNVQDLEKCGFNKQNILGWANSWRDKEPCKEADKVIPEFVECVEHDAHSDIRVKFAGVGSKDGSYSYIGKQAQDHKNDHTMFLNLSNGGDDYKEHTVVHEFGHALGMLHEHQRPEIWSIVKKYLAPESEWYKKNNNYKGVDGAGTETSATYDTTSVMHYPNFKYGLKYKTIKAIENDHLNQKHAVVLKAIVSMDGTSFCSKPSDIDIDFLRQKYTKGSPSQADTKLTPGTAGPSTQESGGDGATGPSTQKPTLKEVTNILKKYAAYWHEIGVQLDFEAPELDEIKKDHPNDHKQCLSKLLGRWLKRRDASWTVLGSALEECDDIDEDVVDKIKSK